MITCKAKTKNGKKCGYPVFMFGYCVLHFKGEKKCDWKTRFVEVAEYSAQEHIAELVSAKVKEGQNQLEESQEEATKE